MKYFKRNFMNTLSEPAFVIDINTGDIVAKNNSFFTTFEPMNIRNLLDIFPTYDNYASLQQSAISSIGMTGVGLLKKVEVAFLYQRTVFLDVSVGYFNDDKTQLYFVLTNYHAYLEFIKFRDISVDFPECIAILGLDDDLTLHYANKCLLSTFSGRTQSFAQAYGYSFAAAIPAPQRQQCIEKIKHDIQLTGSCHQDIELTDSDGAIHHISFHATLSTELPYHQVICVTIQLQDQQYVRMTHLEQENEMFHAVTSLTSNILFRLSLETMRIEFYGSAVSNFDVHHVESDMSDSMIARKIIYHEDIPVFLDLLEKLRLGEEIQPMMRANSLDGRCDWYSVQYVITRDASGKPLTALGQITNIQQDKELENKANIDLLTSCLNKGTFESYAMNILSEQNTTEDHAFLIIDIDNFKAINDNLGHFFGDIVLKEISGKLKRIFRKSDYVARIGGDEFAILMRDAKDRDIVLRKAREIVDALNISYKDGSHAYQLSASIGISLYPEHAATYEDLYKRADIALYAAKHTGKNDFKLYDHSLEDGSMANTTPFDVASRAFSHFFDQEVAMDTFNLLFDASNRHDALNLVLSHLGERYHVDRCYIFEALDAKGTTYCNTFEWCRDGVIPQRDLLQNVDRADFEPLFSQANNEGVFYCNDVSTLTADSTRELLQMQGIVSLLHTYVKRDGVFKYALGFDDCTSKRIWSPSEISTLMYASKIISQFLLYSEALRQAAISSRERLEVMDSLNFYAYIIEDDTHKVYYYNDITKEIIPDLEIGSICYESIRGRTEECPDCPLKTLREKQSTKVRSVIYNDLLDIHVLVTASALSSFSGKPCTFVSSTDISDIIKTSHVAVSNYDQLTKIE